MIKMLNLVPPVYNNASRDFQYLSWLINIVLNSVKHNVDDLYDLPNSKADPRLVELLALTLGFKVKRNYDRKQLEALVSIIPSLLKCKGTDKAIEMAGEALIKASGSIGIFSSSKVKGNLLEVLLPKGLVDTTLFVDLLPYILPAGMTCRIVRRTELSSTIKTSIAYQDKNIAVWKKDLELEDTTNNTFVGPAVNLFDSNNDYSLASFKNESETLNTGLLDNTIIPIIPNS